MNACKHRETNVYKVNFRVNRKTSRLQLDGKRVLISKDLRAALIPFLLLPLFLFEITSCFCLQTRENKVPEENLVAMGLAFVTAMMT